MKPMRRTTREMDAEEAFDDAIKQSLSHTAVVRITLTEPPVGKRKEYDEQGEEKSSLNKKSQ